MLFLFVASLALWVTSKWGQQEIGFHQIEVNHLLKDHKNAILPSGGTSCSEEGANSGVRIFVPLCGKSVDMVYLAQFRGVEKIVGVEGIAQALVRDPRRRAQILYVLFCICYYFRQYGVIESMHLTLLVSPVIE